MDNMNEQYYMSILDLYKQHIEAHNKMKYTLYIDNTYKFTIKSVS